MQFLRVKDVAKRTARSTSQVYKEVQSGLFPKPMKVGGSRTTTAWLESEVERMMKAAVRGVNNAELEADICMDHIQNRVDHLARTV
jgi:predicted DNA-binding transcriptional regulator AlpA